MTFYQNLVRNSLTKIQLRIFVNRFFKWILGISGEDALNDYEATFAPDGHIRTALTLQEDEAQKQVKGLNLIFSNKLNGPYDMVPTISHKP